MAINVRIIDPDEYDRTHRYVITYPNGEWKYWNPKAPKEEPEIEDDGWYTIYPPKCSS